MAAKDFFTLHAAQSYAYKAIETRWFPCYSEEYINTRGSYYFAYRSYSFLYTQTSRVYYGAGSVAKVLNYLPRAIFYFGDYCLGWAIRPAINLVYPVNPVNGLRHFGLVLRRVEQFLGDWFFSPLALLGTEGTLEPLQGGLFSSNKLGDKLDELRQRLHKEEQNLTVSVAVKCIFDHVTKENSALLNPPGKARFNYFVHTITSDARNAWCMPGGGIVVTDQLMEQLQYGLQSIKDVDVTLADGSIVSIDLSDVTLQDGIGGILTHELTHGAGRHLISIALILNLLLLFGSLFVQVEKRLAKIAFNIPHLKELVKLLSKMLPTLKIINFLGSLLSILSGTQRFCEYESDITSIYMLKEAKLNVLGMLFALAVLKKLKQQDRIFQVLMSRFEFLFSHPNFDNRLRVELAAIAKIDPKYLRDKIKSWTEPQIGYEYGSCSPAIQFAKEFAKQFGCEKFEDGKEAKRVSTN